MQHVDILLKNAWTITMDKERRVLEEACIAVKDDRIVALGGQEVLQEYSATQVKDLAGRIVLPGFISTHSHLFQTMLKGLGRDKRLIDWLNSSVRVALHSFDAESIYYAALVGCIEAIRTGTTTLLDFQYCHPQLGMDEAVLQAFDELGIRGILGRAFTNVSSFPPEIALPVVETEKDFFDAITKFEKELRGHSRLSVAIAPGIIWDHTADGFREMRRLANELHLPLTMHIVESVDDDKFSLDTYGKRAIPQMEELGFLGPDFIAVHCVNMTDEDFEIFKRNDVKISYNPVSNMILASGAPPMHRFASEGFCISLACDGSASNDSQNMLEVIKTAALLQKVSTQDPLVFSASQTLEAATLGGAVATGKQADIGSLEVGKKADLTVFKPGRFSLPMHDPISALVYSNSPENVESVMVDGRFVLEKGAILNVDEEKVMYEAQRLARKLVTNSGLGNTQWGQKITPPTL